MSKVVTLQQQQAPKSKIIKLRNPSIDTALSETQDSDNEDTDNYYGSIIGQFKTVIQDQYKEIDEKTHKLKVVEKALVIRTNDCKNKLGQKDNEIKDKDMKIKLLEQEMQYLKEKEVVRSGQRSNTRKIVQELHEINTKRRDRDISDAQLDAEAREYLKNFE